jgi:AhpD family alkylhydroperoxidase
MPAEQQYAPLEQNVDFLDAPRNILSFARRRLADPGHEGARLRPLGTSRERHERPGEDPTAGASPWRAECATVCGQAAAPAGSPRAAPPIGKEPAMPISRFVEYQEATPEVRAVYDDIMETRGVDWVNNFWKALAQHPATLARTWASLKEVMAPGSLDPVVKEMIYVAVSVTNNCDYCINSHTAAARRAGMSEAMLGELLAVVAMANETNSLANAYQVEVDDKIHRAARGG